MLAVTSFYFRVSISHFKYNTHTEGSDVGGCLHWSGFTILQSTRLLKQVAATGRRNACTAN
jgi:hypothetical protein